jgi:hypothetical protein
MPELDVEALKAGRILYVDPGEDTGWCIGRDSKLLAAGTEKMWTFADEAWGLLSNPSDLSASWLNGDSYARVGCEDENIGEVVAIVCEDFRIYPWKAQELKFNRVRTARLIGALTWFARHFGLPFILQPAAIKKAAQSAGAEELYYKPLHENRHQNDAIQHYVFFTNTELRGIQIDVPDEHSDSEVA